MQHAAQVIEQAEDLSTALSVGKNSKRIDQFVNGSLLRFVLLSILATLAIMAAVQAFAFQMWAYCEPGEQCKQMKTRKDIFAGVIYDRIPKLIQYGADRDLSYIGAGKTAGLYAPTRDCVQPFIDALKLRVGNLSTQPEMVRDMRSPSALISHHP